MTDLLNVRVARKAVEAQDICTFELHPLDRAALPGFTAGSHLDVHLPGGTVRQYSLCNEPNETHRYLIGVLRDAASRGGSRAMHEQVHEGQVLTVSPPRNRFALAPQASHSLLLAGGIGITPLLCMAEALWRGQSAFELHYGTRSIERTAFRQRLQGAPFAARVHFHHDDGAPSQRFDLPALLAQPSAGRHVYVCGPQGFLDAVLGTARALGWPDAQVHHESFGASVKVADTDAAFEVQIASTGAVVQVPSHQTIVQALAGAGVSVQTSCEQGVCGTCLTRVIDGIPDHRDVYLTPDEAAAGDQILPCCSRARCARLVLDL